MRTSGARTYTATYVVYTVGSNLSRSVTVLSSVAGIYRTIWKHGSRRWKPKFSVYPPLHISNGSRRNVAASAQVSVYQQRYTPCISTFVAENHVDYSSSAVCISNVHAFMGRICILCPRCILVSAGFKALSGICLSGQEEVVMDIHRGDSLFPPASHLFLLIQRCFFTYE